MPSAFCLAASVSSLLESTESAGAGEEQDYVFDDDAEEERINGNYRAILKTLLDTLLVKPAFDLAEFNRILDTRALLRNCRKNHNLTNRMFAVTDSLPSAAAPCTSSSPAVSRKSHSGNQVF